MHSVMSSDFDASMDETDVAKAVFTSPSHPDLKAGAIAILQLTRH